MVYINGADYGAFGAFLTNRITIYRYERDWQNVFWGRKYEKLLAIKQRIDPSNLFVCNRCVGSDIILEP